jgi:hypothetical protein
MAYSLFLFMRDVADDDFVGWIDRQLGAVNPDSPDRLAAGREAPVTFPRFVQNAIWRYCAGNGLAVCNGNRIDDSTRCENGHCQLFRRCDRIALRAQREKIA